MGLIKMTEETLSDIQEQVNKIKKYTIAEIRAMFEKVYDGDIRKLGNRLKEQVQNRNGFNYYLQAFIDLGILEE